MFGFGQPYISSQDISEFEKIFNQNPLPIETIFEQPNMVSIAKLNDDKFNIYFEKTPAAIKQMLQYMLEPIDSQQYEAWLTKFGEAKLISYQFYSSELFSANILNLIIAMFGFHKEPVVNEDLSDIKEVLKGEIQPSEMSNDNDVQIGELEPENEQTIEGSKQSPEKPAQNPEENQNQNIQQFDPIGDCIGHQLFEYLMQFLNQDPDKINLTSSGYFAKIINSIIYIQPQQVVLNLYLSFIQVLS